MAAPNFTASSLTSTGPYTSGELATYTLTIVNNGDAPTAAGSIQLMANTDNVTVVGTPTVTDGPTAGSFDANDVTVAEGDDVVVVNTTLDTNEDVTVTFQLRMPARYVDGYKVSAFGMIDGIEFDESDAYRTVKKGSGSQLDVAFPADPPKFAAKDGTWAVTISVTNSGAGAAELTRANVWVDGTASVFSPDWGSNPKFTPTATLGGCTLEGADCNLGTLAPGETKTYTMTVGALTHYGLLLVGAWAEDASGAGDSTVIADVPVTNGKKALVLTKFTGPDAGAGNTDITYTGEFVNSGSEPIDAAHLQILTDGYNTDGKLVDVYGGTEVESIRSITVSNGASCAPAVNNYVSPAVARKNDWSCMLTNVAPGQRITFTVVANFPTSQKSTYGRMAARVTSTSFLDTDSDAGANAFTVLNAEKAIDLETTLTSRALIGADRLAPVTVTVKNNGPSTATNVFINGDVRGAAGAKFDADTLPATCSGIHKPMFASCTLGDIEPGQTKSVTLNARAGTKLGSLAVTFTASSRGVASETNFDNDTNVIVLDVVKANAVPLIGVKVTKPPVRNIAQLTKSGLPTTVTCPTSCSAKVQLQVKRTVAEKLGLVKKPRKATRRAKKPLPYIVIGTATRTRKSAGKVVVTAKLTRAYKLKVAKLRAPLGISRVLTVTSTDKATRGASFQRVQSVTVKPVKKKPVRKPRR